MIFKGRVLGPIVDLPYFSSSVVRGMVWQISKCYTHSGRQVIFPTLETEEARIKCAKKWKTGYLAGLLKLSRRRLFWWLKKEVTTSRVTKVCDSTVPPRHLHSRKSNYWWNQEISLLKSWYSQTRPQPKIQQDVFSIPELTEEEI